MSRFIVLSFLVMGWSYYELSGGADFVAEQRPAMLAEADTAAPVITPQDDGVVEIVTRADTTTLDALPQAQATTPETIALAPDTLETAVPDVEAAVQAALQDATVASFNTATLTETRSGPTTLDLRQVTGDQVNMRDGPGTDYSVLDKLAQGSVIVVVETGIDGWVRVEVERTGLTGWMSDRFLAPING